MKPEDRKRLKQHIEMVVEHKMPVEELKPCPFCKCTEIVAGKDYTRGNYRVDCLGCSAFITAPSLELAIQYWNSRPIEDELRAELEKRTAELHYANTACMEMKHELDRLNAELLELNDKAVFIKFENEDELPAEIKDDVYSAMFECSHVDGVRLFPYIEENGQKYFLVMLKEVV